MQAMHGTGWNSSRRSGLLQEKENLGVARVRRLRFIRRYYRVLTVDPEGQIGGTVIPPCDFQSELDGISVNRGVSRLIPSRNARTGVRPRVQVRPRVINPLNKRQ